MAPIYEIDYTRLYNGLDTLKVASLEQLKDISFVETVICDIGLHSDREVSDNYGEINQQYLAPHGMLQQPRQLAEALVWLSGKGIRTYLEIGTFNGVATGMITGYLSRFTPKFVTTTIDITERYNNKYRKEMEKRFEIYYLIEDSKNVRGLGDDLVFIDADHNYSAVKSDYENIGKTAKYCMFHDIAKSWQLSLNDGGAYRLWEEIKEGKKYKEFLHSELKVPTFGIGILEQI